MNYSPIDSNRFNFRICRDELQEIPTDLWQSLFEQKADIAILRLSTKKQHELHLLDEQGIPYLVADTFVEYSAKVIEKASNLMNQEVAFVVPSEESDWQAIDEMVIACFAGYPNHYYSNPYLDRAANVAGYQEWVRSCKGPNGIVYMVQVNQENAGFFSLNFKDKTAHAGPGGIIPRFEGSGLYLDFFKRLPALMKAQGMQLMKTSTQVQNLVVQRQWQMTGWQFSASALSLHIPVFIARALASEPIIHRFEQANLLAFIAQICSALRYTQIKIKSLHTLESGAEYSVQLSNEIPNTLDSSRNCRSIVISKDGIFMAIAWLN